MPKRKVGTQYKRMSLETIRARLDILVSKTQFAKALRKVARRYNRRFVQKVREVIRERGHIDTGRLHKGIYAKVTEKSLIVGASVPYGRYVERYSKRRYGTGFLEQGMFEVMPRFLDALEDEVIDEGIEAFEGK